MHIALALHHAYQALVANKQQVQNLKRWDMVVDSNAAFVGVSNYA